MLIINGNQYKQIFSIEYVGCLFIDLLIRKEYRGVEFIAMVRLWGRIIPGESGRLVVIDQQCYIGDRYQ